MLEYDDLNIFTWEITKGKPIKPIVLKIIPLTGQIIGREIGSTFVRHIGVVRGQSITCSKLYICSFTTSGI